MTGAPEGWTYRIRTGSGPKAYVDLDGFVEGVLLEAKGPGYLEIFRKMGGKSYFRAIDDMVEQAQSQLQASGGLPIRWHFAEKEVADMVRKIFADAQLDRIQIVHTPLLP